MAKSSTVPIVPGIENMCPIGNHGWFRPGYDSNVGTSPVHTSRARRVVEAVGRCRGAIAVVGVEEPVSTLGVESAAIPRVEEGLRAHVGCGNQDGGCKLAVVYHRSPLSRA